ncbi:hypothetical protein C8J57DRAFT_132520 [Mycena rebaudengoi]|nr:hypothetical protein C8J57DRAFT_132520 [Mycena rebaudengoi]
MSKSRSVTPTPNFYSPTNISSPSAPAPSRTSIHDPRATTASEESLNPSPTHFTHFHSFVSSQTSDEPTHRRPSPDSPPMAKRLRHQSPEDTSRSQSSDSQSGMADTEDLEDMSPYSETSPPSVAPLKKKRTRTLTTPHQSAVLHALLAQSRFPTTAMREEVGRSIGLSARKVQIWFQNQRQKARRPGSQSDTSQSGAAQQYSSFQNATPYSALPEGQITRVETEERAVPHSYSGYPPSQFVETPLQLLGPGMPGRSSQRGRPVLNLAHGPPGRDYVGRDLPAPPHSSRSLPGLSTLDSENPEGPFSFRHGHDPSRTLPPLFFNQPSSRRLYSGSGSQDISLLARSAPTTPSHDTFRTSPSPSPTFAHNLPEERPYSALGLPPPFTLQPQPQWDSSSSHRQHSPSRSLSGSHSTRTSSSSPPTSFINELAPDEDGDTPRLGSAQPSRAGRYDPVRAVFVPYASADPSATSSAGASQSTKQHP